MLREVKDTRNLFGIDYVNVLGCGLGPAYSYTLESMAILYMNEQVLPNHQHRLKAVAKASLDGKI
jgi:hypothetical protein